MKRLLTILAGVVLAATLAACGSSGASGSYTPMPTTELSGGSGASASPTTAP